MNTIQEQAKAAAKKAGLDLRSNKAKNFIRQFVEKAEMVQVGECLCGCGHAPISSKAQFVQGHDARLKSKILHGMQVTIAGMRYAELNWPQIVDRFGTKVRKSA